MEQLMQKYIKYFYIVLIGMTSIQLADVIVKTTQGIAEYYTFALISLSVINIILLISNLIHNTKQRFTECKTNAKLLRLTLAMVLLAQAGINYKVTNDLVGVGNSIMDIIMIEIMLSHRIKSIEYLERKAKHFVMLNQK